MWSRKNSRSGEAGFKSLVCHLLNILTLGKVYNILSPNCTLIRKDNICINWAMLWQSNEIIYMWIFFVKYYVLFQCYLGILLLFDVLDKIKGCLVTATMPQQSYNSNQKGN